MINNRALETHLNELLDIDSYQDYAPNGLQVEGKKQINRVICGVTASLALIEQAIAQQADAIVVHHGYFWKGESPVITGMKQRRIKLLLAHNINLYAYHLPLDGHATLGNNAQLGKLWQIDNARPLAPNDLLWKGNIGPLSLHDMQTLLTTTLQRPPLVIQAGEHLIHKIAWCSGGAQGFLQRAVDTGADAYISGEVSEKTYHEAREYGIHYFAAGHHATERGGVQAIADYLTTTMQLDCHFIDCPNPI